VAVAAGSATSIESGTALVPREEAGSPTRWSHRDLPVMMGSEVERMVGYVRPVRALGAVLGLMGALAVVAGMSLGLHLLAVVSALMSTLILYALWEDTRLAYALELSRRKRGVEGRSALTKIADSPRRSPWQRQRARIHLASLAWRRGDVEEALHWIATQRAAARRGREGLTEGWLLQATEVQLLAQCGHAPEARKALAELAPAPPDERAELVEVETALLVAFASDDPDEVRERLDDWEPKVRALDGVGVGLALLAWANAGRGARDRALRLVRLTRHCDEEGYLARYYPRLWQWIEHYEERFHYGRR